MVKRFEVWNIELNPITGHEIGKIRPCVVVSPDEANKYLKTVVIVPLTSTIRKYPTRIHCMFKGRHGQLAIDQIRAIDIKRLKKKLGSLPEETCRQLCQTIEIMFRF
ncbi:MAG: type II toxin-antitoxin system PemK/MazF family toxin [Bacteroidales bacterium]|nr:type II toxin-antitoxin system PemK/MazF family toxin [Bacteroidales bacterium]